MATFNDADLGTADGSGTAIAATAVNVAAGDLVVLFGKYEGAVDAGASASWDQTVNEQGSIANKNHANNDLNGRMWYGRATSSGTIVGTLNTPAGRAFRKVHVLTFTPAASKKLVFDVEGTAGTGSTDTSTTSAASNTGNGCAVASFAYYGSVSSTEGAGWTPGVGATTQSAFSEYRLLTGAGSITGNCTTTGGGIEWTAQMIAFVEQADAGAGSMIDDSANEWNPLEAQTNPLLVSVW
jgi:hypothetical protein